VSNHYAKSLGFKNQKTIKMWLTAKDIIYPNWELIEKRNERLVQIFQSINNTIQHRYLGNIKKDVEFAYQQIKDNGILPRMKNNGRAIEDVYYSWMQGYICEKVFVPSICYRLGLGGLKRNGKDDLSKIETFKRSSDADLVDDSGKIFVDVQCGTHEGPSHIKKSKVNQAAKMWESKSYVFSVRLNYGTYCMIELGELYANTNQGIVYKVPFQKNELFEGSSCWEIPEHRYESFCGVFE